jgi:RNA polymerase sigma-70 factor (ECF subfamily)
MASAREPSTAGPSVAPVWEAPDRVRAKAALGSLPPEQRQLIELAYFEGMSCSEMASHCDLPLGTVKSRIAAAMSKLRQSLDATWSAA